MLSIVVPTLDAAAGLERTLSAVAPGADELIVADGGSTDATAAAVAKAGARFVAAPRGRGAQMNAGARTASSPFLLFLHADSELVSTRQLCEALDALRADIARGGGHVAGHFALRFARRGLGHRFFYRYLEQKSALNRPHTINGDQGLLLPAAWFRELGGFDERLPFLEDQRIAARIFETGRWITLPGRLLTSARRFEREGAYRRYTLMSLIMGLHVAGCEEFFARAPKVYAAHGETGRLLLSPYLALARRVLLDAGRAGFGIVYRAGRFTRQNSWQPFFGLDVLLATPLRGRRPALAFHDRVFAPLTNHALADALAALLIALWFLVLLPPAFALLDRRPG